MDIEAIQANELVESVKRVQEPYKKSNRKFHPTTPSSIWERRRHRRGTSGHNRGPLLGGE